MRSGVLRVALSLAAFAGVGIGGIAAFDTLANASIAQYGGPGMSGCMTTGPANKVPVGDWVLNVTPNTFNNTGTNTNITLTATLEECQSNNAFAATPPTSPVSVLLTCGASAPPAAPGTCPAGTPTFTSGTGTVTGGNVLTIPTGTSAVTFNVKFSNSGNNTYVIASGSGIGGAGSATDPDAGYDEGHIT